MKQKSYINFKEFERIESGFWYAPITWKSTRSLEQWERNLMHTHTGRLVNCHWFSKTIEYNFLIYFIMKKGRTNFKIVTIVPWGPIRELLIRNSVTEYWRAFIDNGMEIVLSVCRDFVWTYSTSDDAVVLISKFLLSKRRTKKCDMRPFATATYSQRRFNFREILQIIRDDLTLVSLSWVTHKTLIVRIVESSNVVSTITMRNIKDELFPVFDVARDVVENLEHQFQCKSTHVLYVFNIITLSNPCIHKNMVFL